MVSLPCECLSNTTIALPEALRCRYVLQMGRGGAASCGERLSLSQLERQAVTAGLQLIGNDHSEWLSLTIKFSNCGSTGASGTGCLDPLHSSGHGGL